jgi:putative ABC transport system permease protein
VFIGAILGGLIGYSFGVSMTKVYAGYYRFARFVYLFSMKEMIVGVAAAYIAAVVGTLTALKRAFRLNPAEAMRPPAPPSYRRSLIERLGVGRLLTMPGRMVLRNLMRRPLRAAFSCIGIAFSAALLISGLFFNDAVSAVMDSQFRRAQRQDLTVTFTRPVASSAVYDLMRLPGVISVEPRRAVAAVLRCGYRSYRTVIQGIPGKADLQRILSEDGEILDVPEHGLMLSETLADNLGAAVGDRVQIELTEGRRDTRFSTVTAIVNEPFGTSAYASLETATSLTGGGLDITSALLRIDESAETKLYKIFSAMPTTAAVTSRKAMLRSFERVTNEVILFFAGILSLSAAAMALGIVYNAGRILLSEKERELATMRVVGMTREEISGVLLGELFTQVIVALPLGCLLGFKLAQLTAQAASTEMYRMPVFVSPRTYVFAVAVVLVSSVAAALMMRRRLDRLDLISVLKSKE